MLHWKADLNWWVFGQKRFLKPQWQQSFRLCPHFTSTYCVLTPVLYSVLKLSSDFNNKKAQVGAFFGTVKILRNFVDSSSEYPTPTYWHLHTRTKISIHVTGTEYVAPISRDMANALFSKVQGVVGCYAAHPGSNNRGHLGTWGHWKPGLRTSALTLHRYSYLGKYMGKN